MQDVHLDVLSTDFLIVALLGSVAIAAAISDIFWTVLTFGSVVSLERMTTFATENQTAEKIDFFSLVESRLTFIGCHFDLSLLEVLLGDYGRYSTFNSDYRIVIFIFMTISFTECILTSRTIEDVGA